VAHTVVSAAPNDAVKVIDLATTAVLDEPIAPLAESEGVVEIVDDRPGRISVQVSTSSQQLLVLSERFEEGWRAAGGCIEGPLRVNGDFMVCVVRSGVHRIEFVFMPSSYLLGRRLALAGGGVLVLSFVAILATGRHSHAGVA
jgi:hypothetical protein